MIMLQLSNKKLFLVLSEFIPIISNNFNTHFLLYQNLNKNSVYIVSFHIFKDRFGIIGETFPSKDYFVYCRFFQ